MLNIGERVVNEAMAMLLAGAVLGSSSMLKAAGKYFDHPEQEAARCYQVFCDELRRGMDARRVDPEYAARMIYLDRHMENTLCCQCPDTTVSYEEDMENLMEDLLRDAFRSTLRKAELFQEIRADLVSCAMGLVGLPTEGSDETAVSRQYTGARNDYLGPSGKPVEEAGSGGQWYGNGLFGFRDVDVRLRPSLSRDSALSGGVTFRDVKALGLLFDEGRIQASTKNSGTVGACLKRALGTIGGQPYTGSVSVTAEGLAGEDTSLGARVGLTGELKNGRLEASVGCSNIGEGGKSGNALSFDVGAVYLF